MKRFLAVLLLFFAAVDAGAERGSYTGQFSNPRLSKVAAQSEPENKVVVASFDHTEASLDNHYYFTGTLDNNSYGGVYDISITFIWKNVAGTILGTERALTVYGLPASIRSSYSDIDEDYIPLWVRGILRPL